MSKRVKDNGIVYEVYNDHAIVSGYAYNINENAVILDDINGIPVTKIWMNAFNYCTSLKNITIGNNVTSIGCEAFYSCTSLTSVTIPDSVTNIGDSAFEDCASLTNITIPDSVKSIGSSAFYDTAYYNNESNWENNILYIGNCLIATVDDVSGHYLIKQGTKLIADYAFYDCSSLSEIAIPDSVACIGYCAFEDCNVLEYAILPDSVTHVDNDIFKNCSSLKRIKGKFSTFPPKLKFIDLLDRLNKEYCH